MEGGGGLREGEEGRVKAGLLEGRDATLGGGTGGGRVRFATTRNRPLHRRKVAKVERKIGKKIEAAITALCLPVKKGTVLRAIVASNHI